MMNGLPTTILSAVLAGAIGIGLFFIKHEVKEQEARLSELNREIERNQEAIHVLKAEWSYLNDPDRLRALSEKYLAMKVIGPTQVATLDTLPGGDAAQGPAYAQAPRAAQPTKTTATAKADAEPVKVAARPDTTAKAPAPPRQVAARPAPAVQPAPRMATSAPAPHVLQAPAHTAVAAGRSIVIQSPALAATPALPGETR